MQKPKAARSRAKIGTQKGKSRPKIDPRIAALAPPDETDAINFGFRRGYPKPGGSA